MDCRDCEGCGVVEVVRGVWVARFPMFSLVPTVAGNT